MGRPEGENENVEVGSWQSCVQMTLLHTIPQAWAHEVLWDEGSMFVSTAHTLLWVDLRTGCDVRPAIQLSGGGRRLFQAHHMHLCRGVDGKREVRLWHSGRTFADLKTAITKNEFVCHRISVPDFALLLHPDKKPGDVGPINIAARHVDENVFLHQDVRGIRFLGGDQGRHSMVKMMKALPDGGWELLPWKWDETDSNGFSVAYGWDANAVGAVFLSNSLGTVVWLDFRPGA